MDLQAIEPIIEEIVKKSLSAKVYRYGINPNSVASGKTNRVASGTLVNSVKAKVEPNKQGIQVIQVTFLGGKNINDEGVYAYWLANGRGPGFAPVRVIEKWIMDKKSFKIRNLKTGQFLPKNKKNVKSVAIAIVKSMGRFGFRSEPQNFIEVSYDMILNDPRIPPLLEDATFDELLNAIEGI